MNYPMQNMAKQIEAQGRYGDDVLVHMNPAELQGLAALSPTGKLTRNPQTGQPEAFLPLIAAGLGSYLGSAALGTTIASGLGISAAMGSAIAGGIGSGLATAAVTGDIERGFAAGLAGAGLGAAFGAAGAGAADTAAATTDALANAATAPAAGMEEIAQLGIEAGGIGATEAATQEALANAIQSPMAESLGARTAAQTAARAVEGAGIEAAGTGIGVTDVFNNNPQTMAEALGTAGQGYVPGSNATTSTFAGRLKAPFQEGSELGTELFKPRTMFPVALGLGSMAEMDQMDDWNEEAKKLQEDRSEKLRRAYGDLQRGYAAAQPGAMRGTSPYRGGMSWNTPPPWVPGMAQGGHVSDYHYQDRPYAAGNVNNYLRQYGYSLGYNPYNVAQFDGAFPFMGGPNPGYGGIDPVTIQANLRGTTRVTPRPSYQHGFNPEFSYYQNLSEGQEPYVPSAGAGHNRMGLYRNSPINRFLTTGNTSGNSGSYRSLLPPPPPEENPEGKAEGGITALTQQAPATQPTPGDLQTLAMAVLGQVEQGDAIINAFIEKYGVDMFRAAREMILKSAQPDAQTEGMVRGEGGGMDDQVPGMIGDSQPVAVSPGEYIVPADVVSGLGDGSSDAGAAELDRMSDNVRRVRQGGSTSQPPPFDAQKVMPA